MIMTHVFKGAQKMGDKKGVNETAARGQMFFLFH